MAEDKNSTLFASLVLHPLSTTPLYRQLYDRVRDAILQGHLRPGARLPSTRALADQLNLSRNTVELAYEQLLAEGYVEGKAGSGTYVSHALPEQFFQAPSSEKHSIKEFEQSAVLSRRGKTLISGPEALAQHPREVRAFDHALPAVDEFPFKIWARLVARRWRTRPAQMLGYGDPGGYRPLREAIAAYLATTRAVQCTPDQVIIASGSLQPLDQVARVLLDPEDEVWLEDPCYPGFRRTLLGTGARVIPVPVDSEGLDVTAGMVRCPNARMAHVTPSHQYPLGMTMSLPRRMALLEWASRTGAWIVEDDYGSEYRYRGRPLASLQGLDRKGRVIYLGSFSRVLFPSLRLGYIVVPPALIDAFIAARAVIDGPPRTLDQSVVADFMLEGHFVRHLRRMRMLYTERQEVLVRAAERELGGLLEVQPAEAGMFLLGRLPCGINDLAVSQRAAEHGVTAEPLSPLNMAPLQHDGLFLGYTALNARQIREGVRRLAKAIHGTRPGTKT